MSQLEEQIKAIKLFNEKARILQEGNFYNYLKEHKSIGIKIGGKLAPGVETNYPDEEAIRSFLLTFRFFIRDRDGCSFRCLGMIYPQLPIPSELKEKYKQIRNSINNFLDSNTHAKISQIGVITNRELLENFMYGHYVHVNQKKKQILDKWLRSKFTELFLKYEFCCILSGISDIIPYIVDINNKALEYLSSLT